MRTRPLAALSSAIALGLLAAAGTVAQAPAPAQPLKGADVLAVIAAAAQALADDGMAVAVVDRTGAILGVYTRRGVGPDTADIAVSLARTAAFFSNDQAPLSSRTIRYISGIHFPPAVSNTPNAELYGIENTNRGCTFDDLEDGIFNVPVGRARSIRGTFGAGAGTLPLPCRPSDTRGCSVGGPIEASRGQFLSSVGITTGKPNLRDASGLDVAGTGYDGVNPGGIPLYRGGRVIGGVGVAGVSTERAEFAATRAATGAGGGLTTAIAAPAELPRPGAVFIDGIRLPFFGACITVRCVVEALQRQPAGSASGTFSQGALVVLPRDGGDAPDGYLIGPRASARAGGLTVDDLQRLVQQAVAKANDTRAMIRLPLGQATKMAIALADQDGEFLAAFRMPDATFFSLDVALEKARNAYYFSTREGYEVLRGYVDQNPYDKYRWEPDPPAGQGWAITNRTLNFGGQPLFPPGIDREKAPTPGPWFDLFVYDSLNPCTEGPGPSRGGNRAYLNQSGIVWFPGSAPLYKNGRLVGGLGVSGDGVTQDDVVTAAAVVGFEPPEELRVDRSVIRTGAGDEVRLPYVKFPRNPEQR